MRKVYDAIVVGTGPAGATAAYFMGRAGLQVLVLEKETLPRYKACGGGVSQDFLERVFPFTFQDIIHDRADHMAYRYGPYSISIPVPRKMVTMVDRITFDSFILFKANAVVKDGVAVRGVEEERGSVVVTTESGEKFQGRYLVGADGANSRVARSLGLRQKRHLVAALEGEIQVPPPVLEEYQGKPTFIFGQLRTGYLWVFPKADHLSFGAAALHPRKGILTHALEKTAHQLGIPYSREAFHGHPIPIYWGRDKIASKQSLLVGDAAGLVDPLSGEGIRYAIKSGKISAESIISSTIEEYQARIFRYIGRNHIWARLVAQVFYPMQEICLLLGAPNPFTTHAILDLLSDRAPTSAVFLRSIATLPLFYGVESAALLIQLLRGAPEAGRFRNAVYAYEAS